MILIALNNQQSTLASNDLIANQLPIVKKKHAIKIKRQKHAAVNYLPTVMKHLCLL